MDELKNIRWRQRFENFEKSYELLEKYSHKSDYNELERAGITQLFEIMFELSWNLFKDYLEWKGFIVNSPREAIKQAFQVGLIDDGHVWIKALSNRNLSVHTYDEEVIEKLAIDIIEIYLPEAKKLYEKLKGEY